MIGQMNAQLVKRDEYAIKWLNKKIYYPFLEFYSTPLKILLNFEWLFDGHQVISCLDVVLFLNYIV